MCQFVLGLWLCATLAGNNLRIVKQFVHAIKVKFNNGGCIMHAHTHANTLAHKPRIPCSCVCVCIMLSRINKQGKFANIIHIKFTKWLQQQLNKVSESFPSHPSLPKQVYTTKWWYTHTRARRHTSAVQRATNEKSVI